MKLLVVFLPLAATQCLSASVDSSLRRSTPPLPPQHRHAASEPLAAFQPLATGHLLSRKLPHYGSRSIHPIEEAPLRTPLWNNAKGEVIPRSAPTSPEAVRRRRERSIWAGLASAKALVSVSVFIALDIAFRQLLASLNITFPSALIGMGLVFASLLVLERVNPSKAADVAAFLDLGASEIKKWLPVFFAPNLVVLPLNLPPQLGRIVGLVVAGLLFSLTSTAGLVAATTKVAERLSSSASSSSTSSSQSTRQRSPPSSSSSVSSRPPKYYGPFGEGVAGTVAILSAVSFGLSVISARQGWGGQAVWVYLLSMTLSGYVFGTSCPPSLTRWLHPVVICSLSTILGAVLLGSATQRSWQEILAPYILANGHVGPGNALLFLLGPAVLTFGCQMYAYRRQMRRNLTEVIVGCLGAALLGLFGTAIGARLIGLASDLRLATLPRSITAPLAIEVANMLGADGRLAVALVVLTGILGANFGALLLTSLGITNPTARGLAMGSAAHGLGTAAIVNEGEAFTFSAIAMALTATWTTVLVSIKALRDGLVKVALG
ncbi:unnamed protein product [Vitrella brassicaformis CCMP3155]|uniref:LrgB-like protein n=3 Tax=Vitrella brassicaformis TaxID=1169539 RepID=A0A0G4H6K0_VITBC|nr:unnamed protein product [Vitrella brassicaformis CCMP3155]|mmetsp:Transcript_45143/g.127428  ORF Transcript_45143/g.127428 Transcript_45143/m.127428 type:complete len:548 (+) Transcript_45143:110-1753(+)|eukprot:CEM39472.1 unnamed protein product [Vitrella brassicaformis CCMP3155]